MANEQWLFFRILSRGSSMESEKPIEGNTCGYLDHQGLSSLPNNQPMKIGSVIRRSFGLVMRERQEAPGTEYTSVS
jgi:hypothetical protein